MDNVFVEISEELDCYLVEYGGGQLKTLANGLP